MVARGVTEEVRKLVHPGVQRHGEDSDFSSKYNVKTLAEFAYCFKMKQCEGGVTLSSFHFKITFDW
jgi:hypothetical protein